MKRLASRLAAIMMIGAVRMVFALSRALGPTRASATGGWLLRKLGPITPQQRVARDNLAAAFPEKSETERAAILEQAWDSLGRTAGEYAHMATLFDYDADNPDPNGRIEVAGIEHFAALRDDGKPGIIFSAHLANWELPAICAERYGLAATAVFRPPNDPAVAAVIHEIRSGTMGGLAASMRGAAFEMHGVLEKGGHLGMLIDQHFTRGIVIDFMGQKALANPVLAKFARRFECPVHGVRVIRLPGHRFRLELTPPLDLPRDASGEIDVEGAIQMMSGVIEGWVREHPGQWLWMHRRWRPNMVAQAQALKEKGLMVGSTATSSQVSS
ncbi:MAG: lipid A biosynthesis lauroyl acyltransferase [Bosea sp. (in: a-proteobacteria)]